MKTITSKEKNLRALPRVFLIQVQDKTKDTLLRYPK